MKKFTLFIITLAFIFTGLLVGLNTIYFRDYVKNEINHYAKKEFNLDIQIGDISFWLPQYIKTQHIKIKPSGSEAITVDKLYLRISLLSYLSGKVPIKSATLIGGGYGDTHIESLKIHLKRNKKFGISYSDAAKLTGILKITKDEDLILDQLRGRIGNLSFKGQLKLSSNMKLDGSRLHIKGHQDHLGTIQGDLSLMGDVSTPSLSLNLVSEKLKFEDHEFTNLDANLFTALSNKGINGDFKLKGEYKKEPFIINTTLSSQISDTDQILQSDTTLKLEDIIPVFLPDLENLTGQLIIHTDYNVGKGLKVEADIQNAKLENFTTGASIENISAHISGSEEKIEMTKLSATDQKDGQISGHGTLYLDEQTPLNIALKLEKMRLVVLDEAQLKVSGDLNILSENDKIKIQGSLKSDRFKLDITELSSTPSLDTVPVTYTNAQRTEHKPKKEIEKSPFIVDVLLDMPSLVSIKGDNLKSEWEGQLKIQGTLDDPEIYGQMKIVDGNYDLNGKIFQLNQGTITFAGNPDEDITLYVIAETDIDRNTIQIIVKGQVQNPEIVLQSNPPMSKKEILSWLIFGKGITDITKFQGNQLNESIKDITKGSSGPGFMSKLKKSFGVDRIDFEGNPADEQGEMKVKVGKYISKNTFLSFSRKIRNDPNRTTGANTLGIETKLTRDLTLQAEVDDDQAGQLNILWKRNY